MGHTTALFLDARTRRDKEVRVDVVADSLRITSPTGEAITEWPLNRLELIDHGANSDRFVVGHVGNDVSRLTLFDPALRSALIARSPTLKAASKEGKLRRFFIWMGWLPREN
jgi:hypothetical protein